MGSDTTNGTNGTNGKKCQTPPSNVRIKHGLAFVTIGLIIGAAILAQLSFAKLAALNKNDIEGFRKALREEIAQDLKHEKLAAQQNETIAAQNSTIAKLTDDVNEAKEAAAKANEATAKVSKAQQEILTANAANATKTKRAKGDAIQPPQQIQVIIATPVPNPNPMPTPTPTVSPKRCGGMWCW